MKGLLFKEFYLTRKTYLGLLGLALGVSLLGILVCLSMLCGNLQELVAKDQEYVEVFATVFTYAPFALVLCTVCACNHSVYGDYASGWMRYSYALPVSTVRMIGARYLTGGIFWIGSVLYGAGNAVIISGLTNIPINGELVKNMCVLWLIAGVVCLVCIPMALQYKTAQALGNRIGAVLIVAYAAGGAYFIFKINQMSLEESDLFLEEIFMRAEMFRDRILLMMLLIMILLFGISFFLSVKIYQRRER